MSAAIRRLSPLLALLLVAFFWRQGERFLAANGPTFDECVHLAAGYSYWTTGDFRMNNEDPPLLKLWWALPLVLGDRPPFPHDIAEATHGDHWHVGTAFLYQSGVPHQQLLSPARRMNLILGCGIVLLAGWWSYRFWGCPCAGLAVCAFAACDPNLLALSCVLSTDAGFAFFALLSSYLLWEYAGAPSRWLMMAAGISLGLMLASKFSAIAMAAGLAASGLASARRGGTRFRSAFELTFRLALIALVTLAATYGLVHFDEWGRGLKFQLTRAEHGDGRMYLLGELSTSGWYYYFLVAALVKLPLGLLAAALGGLFSLRSNRAIWLIVPPSLFFIAASVSRVDLGIRVVLPAIVFLYVLAGGLSAPGRLAAIRRVVLAACLAWSAWTSWNAGSHAISYFNEIPGKSGWQWVADSNVDWGQGLPELGDYMRREGVPVVYLSYFGTDRPEAYGIRYKALPGYGRVGPAGGEAIPINAPRHVLAISVNNLLGIYLNDPETFAFLRGRSPDEILGGSIFIFDLTHDAESLERIRDLGPVGAKIE